MSWTRKAKTMLCPLIKTCEEYRTKRRYSSVERFRCSHKEHWSKCPLLRENHRDGVMRHKRRGIIERKRVGGSDC